MVSKKEYKHKAKLREIIMGEKFQKGSGDREKF